MLKRLRTFHTFEINFFTFFSNPKFGASLEEMGMNQHCFPFFSYTFFCNFSISKSNFRCVFEKMELEPPPPILFLGFLVKL